MSLPKFFMAKARNVQRAAEHSAGVAPQLGKKTMHRRAHHGALHGPSLVVDGMLGKRRHYFVIMLCAACVNLEQIVGRAE